MKQNRKFCCYCSGEISRSEIEGRIRDYCSGCRTVFYENPLPVVSCIVVNEDREVLLIKREKEPYRDMWCLPIGFAEAGEDMGQAALRELEEEAGIKGSIVRLIDVDTVENYYYGSLAIVAYEVRKIGGEVRPGDDAAAAAYYPMINYPPLAWSSNEKALRIYMDIYRDTWAMVDSFRHLFPKMEVQERTTGVDIPQGDLLSNVLVQIIHKHKSEIQSRWIEEVCSIVPGLATSRRTLMNLNTAILETVRLWLKEGPASVEFNGYIGKGKNLRKKGITLPDMLTLTALSRKSIWTHIVGKQILRSPLEIYTALELNNRIIFLYDKINYYLTTGWCG
jgi:8-oxo-dGTP diphosphatase